jgi:hypothetical protein
MYKAWCAKKMAKKLNVRINMNLILEAIKIEMNTQKTFTK